MNETLKALIIPLVVAAVVGAVSVWGNSMVMDYKINELKCSITELKISKVDKEVAAGKWAAIENDTAEIKRDLSFLVRLHMGNPTDKSIKR